MDEEARLYQNQLHMANQERMGQFEKKLDRTLSVLSDIAGEIKIIPELDRRVDALEKDRSFRKGIFAALAFLGTLVGASLSELFKAWFHFLLGK